MWRAQDATGRLTGRVGPARTPIFTRLWTAGRVYTPVKRPRAQRDGVLACGPDPSGPLWTRCRYFTRARGLAQAKTAALHFRPRFGSFPCMSSKELVLELVRKLPDEASMLDIAREIEFVAGVREAMVEFDRGESISAEQLLSEIPRWAGNTK